MSAVQAAISNFNFSAMFLSLRLYERLGLPVISTARPFSFYRKTFFDNRSEASILNELDGKTLVDIGCGLTPFTEDSMFQVCRRNGISFYGVDPKLSQGFKFGAFDALKSLVTGATSLPKADMPGLEKAIAGYADSLIFEDSSVDYVLCSWLLFAWIQDPALIGKIFTEFDRILKPGGQISIYPTPHWKHVKQKYPELAGTFDTYQVRQKFSVEIKAASLPFSYVTHLVKP